MRSSTFSTSWAFGLFTAARDAGAEARAANAGSGTAGGSARALSGASAAGSRHGPVGSFTDPEYASVGLTEESAREAHDVVVATVSFASLPRPIIHGRPAGFCKLVVDRERHAILGCHIVGERAVELAQVAATAVAGELPVETLARVPVLVPDVRERPRPRRDHGGGRARPLTDVGR